MKSKVLIAGLIAAFVMTCSFPFMMSDDSDALVGNRNMALDSDRAVLYVAAGTNHSFTFSASFTDGTTGNISWKLNNLDDGTNVVSFSDTATVSTATGISATVYGKNVGSIEVEAYVAGDENNHRVSAVVLVRSAPTAAATEFSFWFQVYGADAVPYVNQHGNPTIRSDLDTWRDGFWVTVTQAEVLNPDRANPVTVFNARTALDYIASDHSGWSVNFQSYGWIDYFMGLGTYSSDSTYYYWAQYHLGSDGTWVFNNSTLEFINTQDHTYMGLIFWGSPSVDAVPDPPSLPVSEHLLT